MNKKGISAIVATVLIILITVAAVTVVWTTVLPMLENNLESGTVCLTAVTDVELADEGYTCYNSNSDELHLQISRGSEELDLADIQVLISSEGSTTTKSIIDDATLSDGTVVDSDDLPGANEAKVFVISYSGDVEEVEIAPVIAIGNSETTCDVSSTVTIGDCA